MDTYEVIAVRYASRRTLRSQVYLNHHVYGEPDAPIGMDYYFWVLRNDARTIVVDTGYSNVGGHNRQRGHIIHPSLALNRLDVHPREALVILTHAHYDHAGNLDLFPESEVVVPRREYEFWTGPFAQRPMYHHSIEDDDIGEMRRIHDEDRMRFAPIDGVVAPGVRMIELGGHSPGQAVLLVDTNDGPVLLASDATHYYEELDREMPFLVVDNLAAMYAGFDTMKAIIDEHDAILVPGHDPAVFERHEPVNAELADIAVRIGHPTTPPALLLPASATTPESRQTR
ncbi:N-acyl homoserine lactonase family protein [Rhodococcus sp. NCIMB 12038]|uniref:N-acyl homoserine lactonase family protein n=1 Tax=Rhodococcus sp. NCIMB 12038 TaxID=933800 RepID=UPI000B3CE6CB|nr:N-acyl homoserine lactonase family protein [Rhodococcus sp. NCIMB 12038]OUS91374.1 N-acyl homoserine lactonase family protein [Rhodococcus sp. NCIMB 12038]